MSGVKGAIFQGCQSYDEAVDLLTFSNLSPILVFVNGEWVPDQQYKSSALSNDVPHEIMYSESSDPSTTPILMIISTLIILTLTIMIVTRTL